MPYLECCGCTLPGCMRRALSDLDANIVFLTPSHDIPPSQEDTVSNAEI